jgi:hypothetical protein
VQGILEKLSGDLSGTFRQAKKLCELTATLPSTTVSVECTISALNRIMNYLRSTLGQERLSNLTLLATEKALLKKLKTESNFYDRVITEFLQRHSRRMDFIPRL